MKLRTNSKPSLVACLGIVVIWIAGCKPKSNVILPPPVVEVATVIQAEVPIYHEWIGTLDGLVNAQIRAQVTGYLLTQNYGDSNAIKIFVRVVESGSFSAVARELGVALGELRISAAPLPAVPYR